MVVDSKIVGKIVDEITQNGLTQPWIWGGRTYIPGVGILVVIDGELALDGVERRADPGRTEYSFEILSDPRGELVDPGWGEEIPEHTMQVCWACHGAGRSDFGVCPACHGRKETAVVEWAGARVLLSHVMILRGLPGLRVDSVIVPPHPLSFAADGGLRGTMEVLPARGGAEEAMGATQGLLELAVIAAHGLPADWQHRLAKILASKDLGDAIPASATLPSQRLRAVRYACASLETAISRGSVGAAEIGELVVALWRADRPLDAILNRPAPAPPSERRS